MGFSFFFHGLGSNLITTVGSERPEDITFQGKWQKKSAMGRSVPKRWAQVDFTEASDPGAAAPGEDEPTERSAASQLATEATRSLQPPSCPLSESR